MNLNKCKFCGAPQKVLFKADSFSIYSCLNCKISATFPKPIAPDYSLKDFHSDTVKANELKKRDLCDLPKDWRKLIELQICFAEKYLKPKSRILDIGCGEGLLLNELQKLNFEVTGVEPSVTATQRALEKDLSVICGSFPEVIPTGSYDLIIASHVLEHFENPDIFIRSIRGLLKGGILILTQSNYKGIIPRIKKEDWYAWVPDQHFWHFTIEGLQMFLSEYNFELVDVKYSSLVHPDSLTYRISQFFPILNDQFTAVFKLSIND